ncbi:MAG: hypothetical protein HY261_07855 [Chloroflexi bacterium]|nr:hypothetical protein [Chloroflexota bacterium]
MSNRLKPGLAVVALLVVLLFWLTACGGDDTHAVRGLVTAVSGTDVIQWETIDLQDSSGKQYTFIRGDTVDTVQWRAAHLREHKAGFEPLTVYYKSTKQGLVATRITD